MNYIKAPLLATLLSILGACGGGDSSSVGENSSDFADCVIALNVINLSSGETCYLNKTAADLYGVSPGEISCLGGIINYEGNQFSSGNTGTSFNGLSVNCS